MAALIYRLEALILPVLTFLLHKFSEKKLDPAICTQYKQIHFNKGSVSYDRNMSHSFSFFCQGYLRMYRKLLGIESIGIPATRNWLSTAETKVKGLDNNSCCLWGRFLQVSQKKSKW